MGKDLVHGLRSVLFQLTPARHERLRMRGCNIAELFCPLMQKTYNDPTKHHHKELPPLSKSDVDEMALKLLELHYLPPFQTSKWKNVADGLASFASQLQKYSSYLSSTTERMNTLHSMMEPARTPGKSSAVVRKEGYERQELLTDIQLWRRCLQHMSHTKRPSHGEVCSWRPKTAI